MKELKGVGVALATLLKDDYSIDYDALEGLVHFVIQNGADYLVVQGTTGESPVFSWSKKLEILEYIIEINDERKPLVFGLGGNNTHGLIENAKDLKDYPLQAILSVSPYYSKPSQKGILRHYKMLADSFPHPIILYNVPARTSANMEAETTLELAKHPNIIGIKEASLNEAHCKKILASCEEDFIFLAGDDDSTLFLIKKGAQGVISVVANVIPKSFSEMVHHALNGEYDKAEAMNEKLQKAYLLCSKEGNPTSIKAGLEALGIGKRTVKPPLFDASDQLVQLWREIVSK